jgi:hypothetical protein
MLPLRKIDRQNRAHLRQRFVDNPHVGVVDAARRKRHAAPTPAKAARMTSYKPVIVVTGANRGIGLEICRQLAGRGALREAYFVAIVTPATKQLRKMLAEM